jgi:hypothetical protein
MRYRSDRDLASEVGINGAKPPWISALDGDRGRFYRTTVAVYIEEVVARMP